MNLDKNLKTIAVAMSGGVDSSVAAMLLLRKGHRVIGITMAHLQKDSTGNSMAVEDAKLVCNHLGISHHLIDLYSFFEEQIIKPFVQEYLAGTTPNPCVHCNHLVKWGALKNFAGSLGADLFATGHYVRKKYDTDAGRHVLLKAAHTEKDQSYALWRLNQDQLAGSEFPLGDLTKMQVRELADQAQLPVAHKAESQEICFIADDDYRSFITVALARTGRSIAVGDIVDLQEKKIGEHRGYPFYTIGQRKGLGVALGRPMYVTRIDARRNRITVGDKKDLLASGLAARWVNWVSVESPPPGSRVEVRIRYKDPGYDGIIESAAGDGLTVRFLQPRPAVTPGQSAVLYRGELLLGGGVITEAIL